MDEQTLEQGIEDVSGYIRLDIASGFANLSQVVDNALEIVSDDYDIALLRPHAEQAFAEALAEQRRSEATWPEITDCDRFDAAYAQLEAAGIVCRHSFSCCGTCAAGEIWEEIDAEREKGREIIGCAHYNCQDTESAVEGCGVYLSYGSVLRGDQPAIDIGHQIADAMRAQGLEVTWDGSLSQRIHVALDWKRRLPGD